MLGPAGSRRRVQWRGGAEGGREEDGGGDILRELEVRALDREAGREMASAEAVAAVTGGGAARTGGELEGGRREELVDRSRDWKSGCDGDRRWRRHQRGTTTTAHNRVGVSVRV